MSKFFIPLGYQYHNVDEEKNEDTYSHVSLVFGPYKDESEVRKAIDRLPQYGPDAQFLVFDGLVFNRMIDVEKKPV